VYGYDPPVRLGAEMPTRLAVVVYNCSDGSCAAAAFLVTV